MEVENLTEKEFMELKEGKTLLVKLPYHQDFLEARVTQKTFSGIVNSFVKVEIIDQKWLKSELSFSNRDDIFYYLDDLDSLGYRKS